MNCPDCDIALIKEYIEGVEIEGEVEIDIRLKCPECDFEEWE